MNTEEFDPTEFGAAEFESAESGTEDAVQPKKRKPRRQIRMGTIVWGLIVATIGILIIAWDQGVKIHPQVAAVSVLFGAGALLVIGSIVTAIRKKGESDED